MEPRDESEPLPPLGSVGSLGLPGPLAELGRREALGLSLFGALGVSMAASWFVPGDAGPVVAAGHPGPLVAAGSASRRPAGEPNHIQPARHRVPAAPEPARVATAHRPLFKVHDVIPHAPKRAVALTIDDGPDPTWTPRVLDLLAHYEITATFCLIGVQVRQHPDLVRKIVEAGHQVANHTMHHPVNLCRLPDHRVDAEIGDAYKEIKDVTGVSPKLFRAPGGTWSRPMLKSVARHGMLPLDWDVDPRDWSRPGTKHITHALLRAKPGDILLCHDGGGDRSETLRALGTVIPRLKRRDLEFISL